MPHVFNLPSQLNQNIKVTLQTLRHIIKPYPLVIIIVTVIKSL